VQRPAQRAKPIQSGKGKPSSSFGGSRFDAAPVDGHHHPPGSTPAPLDAEGPAHTLFSGQLPDGLKMGHRTSQGNKKRRSEIVPDRLEIVVG
jgi:hypothetical protein